MDSSRLSLASLAFLSCIFLSTAVGSRRNLEGLVNADVVDYGTTPSPASKWEVKYTGTDITCIVATFQAKFEVRYEFVNAANQTQWTNTSFSMGDDAHVDTSRSFCYAGTVNQTQAITLTWSPQYMYNLTINFVENPANTSFVIDKILFEYNVNDKANFPNSTSQANQTVVNEMSLVSVPIDTAFECWTGAEFMMRSDYSNVSVWVSELRVEAFRMGTNNSWYDPVQHCSGDPTEPTTTPTTPTTPTTTPTTTPSTTTPAPGPKAQWAVVDPKTNFQCALASFIGKFLIAYDFTNPANHTDSTNTSLSIPTSGVSVDKDASTCNGYTLGTYNQMKLRWMNGKYPYALTLVFNMTAGQQDVVSQLFLEYSLNDTSVFPNATEGASWYRVAQYVGSKPVATISHGTYMKCDTGIPLPEMTETIDKKAIVGELYDVKLEAFRMSKTDTFDDHADVCPGDEVTTTPYPPSTSTMTPPPLNVANYTVPNEHGEACLMALFSMDLAVVWTNSSNKDTNSSWPALNNATVDLTRSMCNNETAVLAITGFLRNWTLVFHFSHNHKQFTLSDITLDFNLTNDNFPNANYSGPQWSHTDGLNALSTSLGKHYMCKVPTHWQLNTTALHGVKEIDLQLEQVQVEAFMTDGNWGPVEECAADNGGGGGGDTSEIVPIAVGCALAALVIIVLIAYVIGRRRNRARGYESM